MKDSPASLQKLLRQTNADNLPSTVKRLLGCSKEQASNLAVAFNRIWAVDIRPTLPQEASGIAIDDAKINHAKNIVSSLKELDKAVRNSDENIHEVSDIASRAISLYNVRASETGERRTNPRINPAVTGAFPVRS